MMAKAPKLKLSFLNSIQICRPTNPSSLVKTPPLPSFTYIHSHSSKTYDISLPTFLDPPPSSTHFPTDSNLDSSNITQSQTPPYSSTRSEENEISNQSLLSSTDLSEGAPSHEKKENILMKKPKPTANSSTYVSWDETDENSSSPPSSFNASCSNGLEEVPLSSSERSARQRSVRTRRFKRYGSKDWKDGSVGRVEPDKEVPEKMVLGRSSVHRRSNESFVVLRRSVDPYQDFKKSMLEMIIERQIFEAKELEQLLMSYLSLNSRMHHKAILKGFSEIWKEVFSGLLN